MGTQWTRRQLQAPSVMVNGVVASHQALDLHAQDLGEHRGIGGYETALRDLRRPGKARIVRRNINVADEPIGGFDLIDTSELQLLRQPILQRANIRSERPRASGE